MTRSSAGMFFILISSVNAEDTTAGVAVKENVVSFRLIMTDI